MELAQKWGLKSDFRDRSNRWSDGLIWGSRERKELKTTLRLSRLANYKEDGTNNCSLEPRSKNNFARKDHEFGCVFENSSRMLKIWNSEERGN